MICKTYARTSFVLMKLKLQKSLFDSEDVTVRSFIKKLCEINSASKNVIEKNMEKINDYEKTQIISYDTPILEKEGENIYLYQDDYQYILVGIDFNKSNSSITLSRNSKSSSCSNRRAQLKTKYEPLSSTLLQDARDAPSSPEKLRKAKMGYY